MQEAAKFQTIRRVCVCVVYGEMCSVCRSVGASCSERESGEATARHEEKVPNKGCERVKRKGGDGREQYQHCEKREIEGGGRERERAREVCFGLHHHFLSALT